MIIDIQVQYRTAWGERLIFDPEGMTPVEMTWNDRHRWTCQIEAEPGMLRYRYALCAGGLTLRTDLGHTLDVPAGFRHIDLVDTWNDCAPLDVNALPDPDQHGENFCLHALADLSPDLCLAVAGSGRLLGYWDKFHEMHQVRTGEWMLPLTVNPDMLPVDYKFVILEKTTRLIVAWENGPDRRFTTFPPAASRTVLVETVRNPLAPHSASLHAN